MNLFEELAPTITECKDKKTDEVVAVYDKKKVDRLLKKAQRGLNRADEIIAERKKEKAEGVYLKHREHQDLLSQKQKEVGLNMYNFLRESMNNNNDPNRRISSEKVFQILEFYIDTVLSHNDEFLEEGETL